MKVTFFYSKKQKAIDDHIHPKPAMTFVHGKEYTECDISEGDHKSNWDDAIIVHIEKNLPMNEFAFKELGKKFAETPDHIITFKEYPKDSI